MRIRNFFFVFVFVALFCGHTLEAATATAADCERLKSRNPDVVCVPGQTPYTEIDNTLTGGACDFPLGDPKTYLAGKLNKGGSCPAVDFAEGFTCCLAKFLYAGQQAGHSITIRSGSRTPSCQKSLWDKSGDRKWVAPSDGKTCSSSHCKGIAADLSADGQSWQHANAEKYGLYFRMSWEPWHIEPKTSGCQTGAPEGYASNPGGSQGSGAEGGLGPQYDVEPDLQKILQDAQKTDATGVTPGSAGTTAGSNPISNAIQQALSSPAQQSATPESNTTSNAFKCLFAAFGSDAEGCADTQARALLGEELGVTDGEDTVVGSTGNDTLSNTAACSDSGSSISRSDTGCLQVGGQGGADNNVPAISTGSVTQTIKDSAVTDSVGAPGPVAQKFVSLGQMFDWPSSTGSPASQYDGQLFYRGQDLPDGLYYDLYTDTIRYESSGREVSPAVLKVLMSEDASSLASTQSISWLGVTGSLVRGALPVLGFTFPLASFFSI